MERLPPNRGAFSVDDFCLWASMSRATFYREVAAGRLILRKVGRKSVVTLPDALSWLDSLPLSETGKAA